MRTKKKKIDWDTKVLEWSYVLFIIAAVSWWCMAVWFSTSVGTLEKVVEKQKVIIQELRQTDRQGCVDLFLNDKI